MTQFNQSQLTWLGITIGLLVFFFGFVPYGFFTDYSCLGSVVAALASGYAVVQLLYSFLGDPDEERGYNIEGHKMAKQGEVTSYVMGFLAFVILGFTYYNVADGRREKYFKEFSIRTKAEVLDGTETQHRSSRSSYSSHNLDIQYTNKEGKPVRTSLTVSSEVFNGVYKGQMIDIIYLPDNPFDVKILLETENAQKFLSTANRPLNANDVTHLLEIKEDSILPYLNSINISWEQSSVQGMTAYSNTLKGQQILKLGDQRVLMIDIKDNFSQQYPTFESTFAHYKERKDSTGTFLIGKDFVLHHKVKREFTEGNKLEMAHFYSFEKL